MIVNEMRMNELIKYIESDQLQKFYKSREWLALRKIALKRDANECQMCKQEGRYHKAENVHHVREVKLFPLLSLQLDNLLCVCVSCHNVIHDRLESSRETKYTNVERW